MSSFIEWQDMKIVYKRYASLYFCAAIDAGDNELLTLEIIHRYVELLDKYFGSVSIYLQSSWFSKNITAAAGVWAGHHIQLWEGLLHARWTSDWRRDSRNQQEKCFESNRGPGSFAGRRDTARVLRGFWTWLIMNRGQFFHWYSFETHCAKSNFV